ncbi:MAG: hypothetical protein ACXWVS_11190 [Hyphomicrobium sp.]
MKERRNRIRILIPLAEAFDTLACIDLLGVVAALGERLRPAREAGVDLLDLGAGIFGRINPVPFRRQPISGVSANRRPLTFSALRSSAAHPAKAASWSNGKRDGTA